MTEFLQHPPQGNPKHYAVAVRYSYDGSTTHTLWGWYCGMSRWTGAGRHIIYARSPDSARIKRYVCARTAERKIAYDAFADPRVLCAVIVPLDPAQRPAVSIFNGRFGRRATNIHQEETK